MHFVTSHAAGSYFHMFCGPKMLLSTSTLYFNFMVICFVVTNTLKCQRMSGFCKKKPVVRVTVYLCVYIRDQQCASS
jgi:hypothetical protein